METNLCVAGFGGQGGLAHVLPHSGHVGGDGLVTLCLCHSINVPPFHHIVPRKPR